jgi:hypothetical protein
MYKYAYIHMYIYVYTYIHTYTGSYRRDGISYGLKSYQTAACSLASSLYQATIGRRNPSNMGPFIVSSRPLCSNTRLVTFTNRSDVILEPVYIYAYICI